MRVRLAARRATLLVEGLARCRARLLRLGHRVCNRRRVRRVARDDKGANEAQAAMVGTEVPERSVRLRSNRLCDFRGDRDLDAVLMRHPLLLREKKFALVNFLGHVQTIDAVRCWHSRQLAERIIRGRHRERQRMEPIRRIRLLESV